MPDTTEDRLQQAIVDYLEWMEAVGYAKKTQEDYQETLEHFLQLITEKRYAWSEIFTRNTLTWFQKATGDAHTHAVRGLARYLFAQGEISQPIANRNAQLALAEIYEHYLAYHQRSSQAPLSKIRLIRRVLAAFETYLQNHSIELAQLKIEHIDAFLAEFFS